MKFSVISLLFATAAAEKLFSCGYSLVNDVSFNWHQSDIAKAACGRTDTCSGREWNTIFEVVQMSSGPSSWAELRSTGTFCSTGCYEDRRFEAKCH